MPSRPSNALETVPNPSPERDYVIHMRIPEFTCLCPKTGQPDFATLILDYVADRKCVELKSLKLYIWSYRDRGAFHEAVTNQILDDLVKELAPRYARLIARFYVLLVSCLVLLTVSAAVGEEKKTLLEEFNMEMLPYVALIEDGVNSIIATKSGAELATPEGKAKLKEEILAMANQYTPTPVVAVYFNRFFMQ